MQRLLDVAAELSDDVLIRFVDFVPYEISGFINIFFQVRKSHYFVERGTQVS